MEGVGLVTFNSEKITALSFEGHAFEAMNRLRPFILTLSTLLA
jgi:hypothetical protein